MGRLRTRGDRPSERLAGSVLLSYDSWVARAADAVSPSLGVSDPWLRRLCEEADESILASLAVVPPSERNSLYRRIVEEIEQVHGDTAGSGVWRLFCVPFLITFEDSIPASQVDAALLASVEHDGRLLLNRAPTTVDDTIEFVATAFEADDLADLPLSVVRRGALDLLSLRSAFPAKHPFVQRSRPQHRYRMFLRCLVGLRRSMWTALPSNGSRLKVEYAVHSPQSEEQRTPGTTDRREPSLEYRLRCRPFEDCDRARRRVAEIIARSDPGVLLK